MYKTYHYDNMPRPVAYNARQYAGSEIEKNKNQDCVPKRTHAAQECAEPNPPCAAPAEEGCLHNIFGLKNDDIIILIIIFILLLDDCRDKLLIAALGFVFFSGLGEKE